MDDDEATRVAAMIGELWPNPPMGEMRITMYAMALGVIPTMTEAVKAVNRLFLDEQYQPTPGQVIDACGGTEGGVAAWMRVLRGAEAVQSRRPMPPDLTGDDLEPLRTVGQTLNTLPTNNGYQVEKLRKEYLTAYRDRSRSHLAARIDPPTRTALPADAGTPIDVGGTIKRIR